MPPTPLNEFDRRGPKKKSAPSWGRGRSIEPAEEEGLRPAPKAPGRVPRVGCFSSIERPQRAARAAFFFRPPAHLNEFDRRGPKKKRPQLGARSRD